MPYRDFTLESGDLAENTQAEAFSGTVETGRMTPRRVRDAIEGLAFGTDSPLTPRTLRGRFSETFNVLDYDTGTGFDVALNAAITAALAAGGWTTVLIPAGSYTMDATVTLLNPDTAPDVDSLSHVTIQGAGSSATFITGPDGVKDYFVLGTPGSGLKTRHFRLQGFTLSAGTGHTGAAFWARVAQDIEFIDVHCEGVRCAWSLGTKSDPADATVVVEDVFQINLTGCTASVTTTAIELGSAGRVHIGGGSLKRWEGNQTAKFAATIDAAQAVDGFVCDGQQLQNFTHYVDTIGGGGILNLYFRSRRINRAAVFFRAQATPGFPQSNRNWAIEGTFFQAPIVGNSTGIVWDASVNVDDQAESLKVSGCDLYRLKNAAISVPKGDAIISGCMFRSCGWDATSAVIEVGSLSYVEIAGCQSKKGAVDAGLPNPPYIVRYAASTLQRNDPVRKNYLRDFAVAPVIGLPSGTVGNVLYHGGAQKGGVEDCEEEINFCLANYATVEFEPNARYKLTKSLLIDQLAGRTLIGNGATLVFPAANFNNTGTDPLARNAAGIHVLGEQSGAFTPAPRVEISNLTLEFEVADGRRVDGIFVSNADDCDIHDVRITGLAIGAGMRVWSSARFQARNCRIHGLTSNSTLFATANSLAGIEFDGTLINGKWSSGVAVEGCNISDITVGVLYEAAFGNETYGVLCGEQTRGKVVACNIDGVGEGIDWEGERSSIYGNIIRGCDTGIGLREGASLNVVGQNVIEDCEVHILVAPGATRSADGNVLDGNICQHATIPDGACIVLDVDSGAFKAQNTHISDNLLRPIDGNYAYREDGTGGGNVFVDNQAYAGAIGIGG
jgi:hypothetical protein